MITKRLINCPFCGSRPRLKKGYMDKKILGYGVGCTNVNCILFLPKDVTRRKLKNYVWVYVKLEWLIESWNRRTRTL